MVIFLDLKLEWNFENFIKMRWMSFWFFCERVGCLNLLDFYWVLTKMYRFFREFFKGIVVWFCDMYLKVGMMVFWHHSINDFCECNTHELNILILEFIISPCSMQHDKFIVLDIVSYQLLLQIDFFSQIIVHEWTNSHD